MADIKICTAPHSLKVELFEKKVPFLWIFHEKKTFARLLENAFIIYEKNGVQRMLEVIRGYEFDGASIPKVVWPLVGSSFEGAHFVMSVFHDVIYDTHKMSKSDIDDIFGAGIRFLGGFGYEKEVAVELFGRWAWKKSKKHLLKMQKFCKLDEIPSISGHAGMEKYGKAEHERKESERINPDRIGSSERN